jgi:RNA polymerase sigma-70 factor (ECF subfamily)
MASTMQNLLRFQTLLLARSRGMLAARMTDGDTPSDLPLDRAMARFAAGDDGALAEVYDLGAPAVYTFLLRLTRDRSLAEDLTQETFLRIHRSRGLYRSGAAVLPWAYTIARRLFLDSVRSRRSEVQQNFDHDSEAEPFAPQEEGGASPSAEDLLADAELAQAVDEALAQIPEAQASAFRLLKGEGLSIAEVAAIMGTSKGSVKLRAHRAYLSLRALLGKRVFGRNAQGDPSVRGSPLGERQGP